MNQITEKEVEWASDASGAGMKLVCMEEIISTDAVAEDSVANLLLANAMLQGVGYNVLTAVAGGDGTAFSLGDPTTAARFAAGIARAAGTKGVGMAHMSGAISSAATGQSQAAAAKLRITATGGTPTAPTSGRVRVSVWQFVFTAPVA